MGGAEEKPSWDPPYGESASTRRKSPPKRSLDGPPSRVEMRVIGWVTPGEFLRMLATEGG